MIVFIFRSRTGDEENEIRYGLWESCNVSYNDEYKICQHFQCPDDENDVNEVCGKILAARAFVTLACIISGLSVIFLCFSAATDGKRRAILLIIGQLQAFLSLVMSIIGVAIGVIGTMDIDPNFEFKWGGSPVIAIIGVVVNFLGAIGSLLVRS